MPLSLYEYDQIYNPMPLTESISANDMPHMILDEAYFGKRPVKSIDDAMQKIVNKTVADPSYKANHSPENAELEKAIIKVFGFKECHVHWEHAEYHFINGFTVPQDKVLTVHTRPMQGFNSKGFYDSKHEMLVSVVMSQALVTDRNLTGPEMTAVLLHEIGHNFDNTIFAFADDLLLWAQFFIAISNPDRYKNEGDALIQSFTSMLIRILAAFYPEPIVMMVELKTEVLDAVPDLRRLFGMYIQIMKSINTIKNPVLIVLRAMNPLWWQAMLIRASTKIFGHKGETYADTFAAAYGYGAEQASALAKLEAVPALDDKLPGYHPIQIWRDLTGCMYEVLALLDVHETNVARVRRMQNSLRYNIAHSDPPLTESEKKVLYHEIDKMEMVMDSYLKLEPEKRPFVLTSLRRLMDCWYNSKPFEWTTFLPSQTYAN